jgi:hypothetical protein
LGAAELPKLCGLLPPGHNLTIPFLHTPIRNRTALDLLPKQIVCSQPAQCVAGTGELTRGVTLGSGGLRVLISAYKSPDEAQAFMTRFGGKLNSREYGDAAIVGTTPTNPPSSDVWFTYGSYFVEVYGLGPHTSRVASLARHIDAELKRMPKSATCETGTGATKIEPPTGPGTDERTYAAPTGTGKAAACFPSDPSAGFLDPARHRAMAANAPPEAIARVLSTRIRSIAGCSQVTPDRWSSLYATISVAVAKHFRDARCFANDTAAINQDWNFHKSQRAPRNSPDSLIFNTDQAVNCLSPQERPALFAEIATAIASALDR